MRLHQLDVFRQVYEQHSASAAAQLLRLSQPAVSMQVRDLERELGLRLFQRSGRQLVPTEAGDCLYRYAASVHGTLEEAVAAMAGFREGRLGTIRIGASTTGVIYYLSALLGDVRRVHPGIEIALTADITDRVREGVLLGHLDIGLVWGPCYDERLAEVPLLTSHFTLILPAGHRLAQEECLEAQVLRAEPFVLAEEHSSTREFVVSRLRQVGIEPRVAMSLRSTEEVKQAVAAGLGLGVVAARAVRCEQVAGLLVARPVTDLELRRPVVLITRRVRVGVPPVVERLARHLCAVAARGVADDLD